MKEMPAHFEDLSSDPQVPDRLLTASAVCSITDYWMTKVGHVNANLMGPAGLYLNFQQRELPISPGHFEDRVSRAARASAEHRHTSSITAAPSNPSLHIAARNRQLPVDQGYIRLVDFAIAELSGQRLVS